MRYRLLVLAAFAAPPLPAQLPDHLDTLALLLHAEDRRMYQPELFEAALRSADVVVRRQATLGAGRIQDPRARRALEAMLSSSDTSAHAVAMFALGLLGDTAAVPAILERLTGAASLATGALDEAPAALGKLGTPAAQSFFSRILAGTDSILSPERRRVLLSGLLVEAWRFGRAAPVREAIAHLDDPDDEVRWRAAYLLGRTRASMGTAALLGVVSDPHPWVRQYAVRGLTRSASDSAGVDRAEAQAALRMALRDRDPGVRINALVALATFGDSAHTSAVVALLRDRIPNVRLEAVTTLGLLPGRLARSELARRADDRREPLAIRRQAFLGLLRHDTVAVLARAEQLATDASPEVRRLAIELATAGRQGNAEVFRPLLRDLDSSVRALALTSLGALHSSLDAEIRDMLGDLLASSDRRLRGAAVTLLARQPASTEQARSLLVVWERESALGDEGLALQPVLTALRRAWDLGGDARAVVESALFVEGLRPSHYLLRRAAQGWPELASHWGEVWPAEVRYTHAEYRALAARYLTGAPTARPRVRFATRGRGTMTVELLGDQAPLTVANFLDLVERRYFDDGQWHRVIPNFVIQDGEGGPRSAGRVAPIRDEFNPVRYTGPVLGMALSGPDTGTSQWFITLSPQPHLDGGYTVFGRLVGGEGALRQVLQGDHLSAVRR